MRPFRFRVPAASRLVVAGAAVGALIGSSLAAGATPALAAEGYYETVPQASLQAISASSVEIEGEKGADSGPLDRVLDGNVGTFWHSIWQKGEGNVEPPHVLVLGTKTNEPIAGVGQILLTPRGAPSSGRLKEFEVAVKGEGSCTDNAEGFVTVATKDVGRDDLGTQEITFDPRPVSCVKITVNKAWDGSKNPTKYSSLAEFNLGVFHEGTRPLPPAPPATALPERPLPEGVVSSKTILDPLALDDRRADNPDRTPIALRLPGADGQSRIIGARPSATPLVLDVSKVTGTAYHVDCQAPAEGANGTKEHPFTSVNDLNTHEPFQPGDALLFKRGTVCEGLLHPHGSGSAEAPITIDAYGAETDPLPIIHGRGMTENADNDIPTKFKTQTDKGIESAVVRLYNQQHWVIRHLELTNYSGDTNDYRKRRRGVVIALEDFGRGAGYEVSDLVIRDVLGLPEKDLGGSGGIQFEANEGPARKPTSFEGIKVHHNTIRHVSRSGINEGSDFRSRPSVGGSPHENPFEVWAPMEVHDNILSDLGGDGIVTQFASGSRITNNTVWNSANHHAGKASAGNNAAMWPWDADHVYYANNHVFDTFMPAGTWDSTAFDADYGTTGTTFEYNVTHDNMGGFMLFCGCGGLSTKTLMRYNLSINDGRGGETHAEGSRLFFIAGQTDGRIYNNTFLVYPNAAIDKGSSANSAVTYQNNVFLAQGPVRTTWNEDLATVSPFRNNLYAGTASTWPQTNLNFVRPDVHPLGSSEAATGAPSLGYVQPDPSEIHRKGRPFSSKPIQDLLGKPVPIAGPVDLGAFQVSPVTAAEVDPRTPVLRSGGFEKIDPWQVSGDAAVSTEGPKTGKHLLSLPTPGAKAEQSVDVAVNGTYRLTAMVKANAEGTFPTVTVTNPNGHAAKALTAEFGEPTGDGWVPVSTLMRTAWDSSTLTVTVTGPGSVDDVSLLPVDDYMVDGSFESKGNSPWRGNGRIADAVSGGLALKGDSENHETVVPEVGVAYELAGWTKSPDSKPVNLGAKNLGEGVAEVHASGITPEYSLQHLRLTPAVERFVAYCWRPEGGEGQCDDVMLVKAWDGEAVAVEESESEQPPVDSGDPGKMDPDQPAPTNPDEPEPTNPGEPAPTDPAQPTKPGEPAPTDPVQPGPVKPGKPGDSDSPVSSETGSLSTGGNATGQGNAGSHAPASTTRRALAATGVSAGLLSLLAAPLMLAGVTVIARRRQHNR